MNIVIFLVFFAVMSCAFVVYMFLKNRELHSANGIIKMQNEQILILRNIIRGKDELLNTLYEQIETQDGVLKIIIDSNEKESKK